MAAFEDRAIAVAAEYADRMLLDVVCRASARAAWQRAGLQPWSGRGGRRGWPPSLAAVEPEPESTPIPAGIVGYLTVPGYSDMLAAAGFGDPVELARSGARSTPCWPCFRSRPRARSGWWGTPRSYGLVSTRQAAAGLDEIAAVPATAGDPGGERTLTALAG